MGAGHADRRPGARGQRPQRVEVELIDEALGRVLDAIAARGWADDVDVVFTTDHGELQGDFGLLFKGPYHVDGLMRLPLVLAPGARRPASAPAVVTQPVGLVDLAPTFCATAGLPAPAVDGGGRPPGRRRRRRRPPHGRVLTEWDSELLGVDVHLRTITRDGWVCTTYAPGTVHDGTEGELYDLADDPLQQVNRWDDPALAGIARRPRRRPARRPPPRPHAPAPPRRARLSTPPRRRGIRHPGGPSR